MNPLSLEGFMVEITGNHDSNIGREWHEQKQDKAFASKSPAMLVRDIMPAAGYTLC
jgi:hypothetical protein